MNTSNFLDFFRSWFDMDNGRFGLLKNSLRGAKTRIFGVKTAVWIDTSEAYKCYIEIPELRAVINKRASMMASAKPCLYKDGEKVESHWLIDLIKKPNATQNWEDVIFSLGVNDALYSNAFAYAPVRSFNIRNLLVPIPSDRMIVKTTGVSLKQLDKEGMIKEFKFQQDDGEWEKLDVNDVVYLMTPDGINLIKPSSRLDALVYPLSNIKATYHKRNVLLENLGAIGILSTKKNDLGGALPMTPEEKQEIQRDWMHRTKDDLIITEADVSWQPMSYPTKDLMLFEELNADKLAIVDVFGLNIYVFSQEKGATFENVKEGLKMAYTDTIIPETQQMYDSIIEQFGLSDEGYYLKADFSHLPIMQSDKNADASALKTRAEAIKIITEKGDVTLTPEQILEILGLNQYQ
jgi:hypothetical protein